MQINKTVLGVFLLATLFCFCDALASELPQPISERHRLYNQIHFDHLSIGREAPLHLPSNARGVLVTSFEENVKVSPEQFMIRDVAADVNLPVKLTAVENDRFLGRVTSYLVSPKNGFETGRLYKIEIVGKAQALRNPNLEIDAYWKKDASEVFVTIDPVVFEMRNGLVKLKPVGSPHRNIAPRSLFGIPTQETTIVSRIAFQLPSSYANYQQYLRLSLDTEVRVAHENQRTDLSYNISDFEAHPQSQFRENTRCFSCSSPQFQNPNLTNFREVLNLLHVKKEDQSHDFQVERKGKFYFLEVSDQWFTTTSIKDRVQPSALKEQDSLSLLLETAKLGDTKAIRNQLCMLPESALDYHVAQVDTSESWWTLPARILLSRENARIRERRTTLTKLLSEYATKSTDTKTRVCALISLSKIFIFANEERSKLHDMLAAKYLEREPINVVREADGARANVNERTIKIKVNDHPEYVKLSENVSAIQAIFFSALEEAIVNKEIEVREISASLAKEIGREIGGRFSAKLLETIFKENLPNKNALESLFAIGFDVKRIAAAVNTSIVSSNEQVSLSGIRYSYMTDENDTTFPLTSLLAVAQDSKSGAIRDAALLKLRDFPIQDTAKLQKVVLQNINEPIANSENRLNAIILARKLGHHQRLKVFDSVANKKLSNDERSALNAALARKRQ